jgi:hypothetical protein
MGGNIKRTTTGGCVVHTLRVAIQGSKAGGGVAHADGVVKQRLRADGCVPVTGREDTDCVAKERLISDCRVVEANRVSIERIKTDCRVSFAGGEAEKCIFALSGVEAGIVSVRRWVNSSPYRRKRKANEQRRDEDESEPHTPPVNRSC